MGLLETLTSGSANAAAARAWLTEGQAQAFLTGCVEVEELEDGWVRPYRFSAQQRQALSSCLAWHPGLFRQMSMCTAGVSLRFSTDATEVAIACRLDGEPAGTRAVLSELEAYDPRGTLEYDGFSATVDGRRVETTFAEPIERALPWLREPTHDLSMCTVPLTETTGPGGIDTMVLPGLGKRHEVEVWLPCLRGVELREVWSDGTYLRPLDARARLLVLADSIGQGFVAGEAGLSWPALLSSVMGLDLLNQSVGGQVFQPSMLHGADFEGVACAIVALGCNYRHEACTQAEVARDAKGFYQELHDLLPAGVPVVAVTPIWHDERRMPSSLRGVREAPWASLARGAVGGSRAQGWTRRLSVVEGARLIGQESLLLADGEHPTGAGHARIARRLEVALSSAGLGEDELGRRALEVVGSGPLEATPLAQCIRRGLGRALFAQQGCVLVEVNDGSQLVYTTDTDLARDACAVFLSPRVTDVFGRGMEVAVSEALGLAHKTYARLCVYEREEPVEVDEALANDLRVLDETYVQDILRRYRHRDFIDEEELARMLGEGLFLGAVVDERLVGFVGEYPNGSIGFLHVEPRSRRKGWGAVLEGAKINCMLERNEVPWLEVYPRNSASVALQRQLGLTVLDTKSECTLSLETSSRRPATRR